MDELFFLASKIGWVFLSPGNLLVFLLTLGILFLAFNHISAAKKILIPTGLVAFVLMAYPISDYLMKPLEKRFSTPSEMPEKVDGIIILGGGEDLKRSLSWKVAELGLGGDRYIGTASLALTYPNVPVIFTGGSGLVSLQNSEGEGALARQILTTIGIQESRLIIESRSRNTYENFKYTKAILPKAKGRYLLVTSSYHMPRAVGIARMQGINVIPYPVDYRTNADELRIFDFDLFDHLKALEPAWREWIGLTVYYFSGKTANWFPKPGEQFEKKDQKVIPGFYSDQVKTFEP